MIKFEVKYTNGETEIIHADGWIKRDGEVRFYITQEDKEGRDKRKYFFTAFEIKLLRIQAIGEV